MKRNFLAQMRRVIFIVFFLSAGYQLVFAQKQSFETTFNEVNFPLEFLPGWYGNEVRSSGSRIFQESGRGINSSKALSVQPISTFNGILWIKVNPSGFSDPKAVFFAKSSRNGTGTRPAQVFFSWGKSLDGPFSPTSQIGSTNEFANEEQSFRRFSIELPQELKSETDAFLRLEIRYGPGTGSAARWSMDDFEFGDFIEDLVAPRVLSVRGYGPRAIIATFDEALDPVFSIFPIAYALEGQNPMEVISQSDSSVVLNFDEELIPAKSYNLRLLQIPDLEGNFLQDTTVVFTFFDPTNIPEKSLVINELMPAPRADQDLPNSEYIELLNRGDYPVRLEGVKLSNSRTETVLGNFWLNPGQYLILVPENQSGQFLAFGAVLPVKNWPSLLNSGDQVILTSADGIRIDQISYTTSSWKSSELATGGYSLEVPNPDYACDNTDLLIPSKDPSRGTPGKQNSVFTTDQDNTLPEVTSAYFRDSISVQVIFSAPILPHLSLEAMEFSPTIQLESLAILNGKALIILLKTPVQPGELYSLRIRGITDCWGNELGEIELSSLVLPVTPLPGELIINELLFDPRSGDPKYVELRNVSEKYLKLDSWALANLDRNGSVSDIRALGGSGLILFPKSYLAVTTDSTRLKLSFPKSASGSFLQIPSLPSYPISGGTVILLSPKGEIFETFTYDEDLHHPLLRDSKGVALERISASSPASLRANWQSSSGNEDFGTPGRINSQSLDEELEDGIIEIDPEVFDPEGSVGPAFTTIRYQLDQSGWVGTFKIYSASGQLIHTLAQNQLLGTNGMYTWTGTDSTGKRARVGYYVLTVELYSPGGETKFLKKTLVIASRM
jgi:hypothetical protein